MAGKIRLSLRISARARYERNAEPWRAGVFFCRSIGGRGIRLLTKGRFTGEFRGTFRFGVIRRPRGAKLDRAWAVPPPCTDGRKMLDRPKKTAENRSVRSVLDC